MLVKDKKTFTRGAVMTAGFFVVLIVMFSPIFSGGNAFRASDNLFNAIAKGSTYYFPDLVKGVGKWKGKAVSGALKMDSDDQAKKGRDLLLAAGAKISGAGPEIKLEGDLFAILSAALADSDAVFLDRGKDVAKKYGFPEREVVYVWWKALKGLQKDLTLQKKFDEAKFIGEVTARGVEPSYNFYGIDRRPVSENMGILAFSLIFYIAYTLWWGYAILFLFDGMGLKMKAGAKREH